MDAMHECVDAGVVDQDVEATEAGERGGQRGVDGGLVSHVHGQRQCIGQAPGHRLRPRRVDVGHDDRRAVGGHGTGDGFPDPTRRAGDEGDLIGEIDPHDKAGYGVMIS